MNTELVQKLITSKARASLVKYDLTELNEFVEYFRDVAIRDYLLSCLTAAGFTASGVYVHNLERIRSEVAPGAAPGSYIFRHGYLVIATSIGGNAICFCSKTGRPVWVDHTSFSEDTISYKDRKTGKWRYLPFAPENMEQAVIPLGHNIETFLIDLLNGKLESKLDELD